MGSEHSDWEGEMCENTCTHINHLGTGLRVQLRGRHGVPARVCVGVCVRV